MQSIGGVIAPPDWTTRDVLTQKETIAASLSSSQRSLARRRELIEQAPQLHEDGTSDCLC